MQEGLPSGIGIKAEGGIGDMYRFASLPEEIEVSCIDGMDRFDVVGVVLQAGSVERELRKETT